MFTRKKLALPFPTYCYLFSCKYATSQYTDVINSNRPGASVSAYALGSNVYQLEVGGNYETMSPGTFGVATNNIYNDLSLRYGAYFETLEVLFESSYQAQTTTFPIGESPLK